MAKIVDNRSSLDNTVRIFDAFYSTSLVIPADKYDIIHGYFTGICPTRTIAENFTALFFRISNEANIDVLELLKEIKGTPNKLQMNSKLAYYMNSFKSKTSLYGIAIRPQPMVTVARNIVQ